MNCHELNAKLADLLLESEATIAEVHKDELAHLADCDPCRQQLEELRATVALLDTWEAPEPNPYFMTRLNARLEEERQAEPAGWLERTWARITYGTRLTLRPVAAMTMTAILLVGGGTYFVMQPDQATPAPETAVVHDLQTLDNNAQLLDQLESLSDQDDDSAGPM